MTAISSLTAMTGNNVDYAADLLLLLDMSLAGNARDKKITMAEFLIAIGAAETITASEAFAGGELANVYASSGVKVRKANAADDTKPANAYVPTAISNAASGLVILAGRAIFGLSGLTPGAAYYLDTTGGAVTATPPSGAGNLVQEVGVALSATKLLFLPKPGITL